MDTSRAIVIAGLIIAGVLLIVLRWEITSSGLHFWRLDRWTGKVIECDTPAENLPVEMKCDKK